MPKLSENDVQKQLDDSLHVCQHCDHHLRVPVDVRLNALFDDSKYEMLPTPKVVADPLKFKAKKGYAQQIKENARRSGAEEAISVAKGHIGGKPVVVAVFNGDFMGGSMGRAVGEALCSGLRTCCS